MKKTRVLILCTANSMRSQMAEGVLKHYGADRFEVESAGSRPSHVHPTAIQLMKEIGIDISGHRSKSLEEFLKTPFDVVITVCDKAAESCPVFPGPAQRLHWPFPDPKDLEEFRRVRDAIHSRFKEFTTTGA